MINNEMTYQEAKTYKQILENKNNHDSKILQEFDKYGKSNMGLTPESVKIMPEFQQAKEEFNKSFNDLRNFNTMFIKTFKKENAIERKNKYLQK